ncbi:hypothetical protein PC119_g25445 [Phytophthora cactorum]|nr:hypothetical protein PC119_g25445 [Phytophthora cactorum]
MGVPITRTRPSTSSITPVSSAPNRDKPSWADRGGRWQTWNGDSNTANVYFKEYKNRGAGAATDERVGFSGPLQKPVAVTDLLGSGYQSAWWVDTSFM